MHNVCKSSHFQPKYINKYICITISMWEKKSSFSLHLCINKQTKMKIALNSICLFLLLLLHLIRSFNHSVGASETVTSHRLITSLFNIIIIIICFIFSLQNFSISFSLICKQRELKPIKKFEIFQINNTTIIYFCAYTKEMDGTFTRTD